MHAKDVGKTTIICCYFREMIRYVVFVGKWSEFVKGFAIGRFIWYDTSVNLVPLRRLT